MKSFKNIMIKFFIGFDKKRMILIKFEDQDCVSYVREFLKGIFQEEFLQLEESFKKLFDPEGLDDFFYSVFKINYEKAFENIPTFYTVIDYSAKLK